MYTPTHIHVYIYIYRYTYACRRIFLKVPPYSSRVIVGADIEGRNTLETIVSRLIKYIYIYKKIVICMRISKYIYLSVHLK